MILESANTKCQKARICNTNEKPEELNINITRMSHNNTSFFIIVIKKNTVKGSIEFKQQRFVKI